VNRGCSLTHSLYSLLLGVDSHSFDWGAIALNLVIIKDNHLLNLLLNTNDWVKRTCSHLIVLEI
jgi:hypothetical protein